MSKISLSLIRAVRAGMTTGKYGIEPSVRLQGAVVVEIPGVRAYQVAMMTGDAPAADPHCPHVASQPGRNALGLAVMADHIDTLLDIVEATREFVATQGDRVEPGWGDLTLALSKVTA